MTFTSTPSLIARWLPSRFLQASALIQVTGWPLALLCPEAWPGLMAVLILNHAIVAAFGFWPQSTQLGPNQSRLPIGKARRREVALTFDDGPDPETTPQVLDLLEAWGATASFFCIGERVQRYPDLVREIHARGHRVENHSHYHRWSFALQGISRLRAEIGHTQDVVTEITGRPPVFFRAPFGFRNPWLGPVIEGGGLQLVSWSRRGYDAVFGDARQVSERLIGHLGAGDILLLHDGGSARTLQGSPVVLEVLPTVLNAIRRQGLLARSLGDHAL